MSVVSSCLAPTSQSFTLWSSPPLANLFPSGEKAIDLTAAACPRSAPISCPVIASHSLIVRSELPVANFLSSGENVTELMCPACPFNEASSSAVVVSHSLTVSSSLHVLLALGKCSILANYHNLPANLNLATSPSPDSPV